MNVKDYEKVDSSWSWYSHPIRTYIPEGCVLVGPRNSRFSIFSDRLLTVSHAIYLVSNKVASNYAKITVFLHISYNYLRTCHPSSPTFELLKIVWPGRWKKCQIPAKLFWGSPVLPGIWGIWYFFSVFVLYSMLTNSILPPKMTHFSLNIPR